MKDLNRCTFTGRLGSDPDGRYTPQGTAVTDLNLAINRTFKGPDGQMKEETQWVTLVAWDKLAEIANQYLKKGSRIYAEGRLQTRSWADKTSGETRYKTEIRLEDFIMLDSKNEGQSGNNRQQAVAPAEVEVDEDGPMGWDEAPKRMTAAEAVQRRNAANATRPVAPKGKVVSDDDIPF